MGKEPLLCEQERQKRGGAREPRMFRARTRHLYHVKCWVLPSGPGVVEPRGNGSGEGREGERERLREGAPVGRAPGPLLPHSNFDLRALPFSVLLVYFSGYDFL